ncbi:hypothetical protein, partial [Streptomyces coeruleorubidus]|uniref:hypothetical protein n=1 Tax=Streptomyces coeruleorubidus TaxID=116188 RepID=UPI0036833E43
GRESVADAHALVGLVGPWGRVVVRKVLAGDGAEPASRLPAATLGPGWSARGGGRWSARSVSATTDMNRRSGRRR